MKVLSSFTLMNKKLFLLFLFSFSALAKTPAELEIAMSDVKPVSYLEEGSFKGINYDILKQIENHSKLKFNYNLYPHSRLLTKLPEVNPAMTILFKNACLKHHGQYEVAAPLYVSTPTIFLKKDVRPSRNLRIGRIAGTCTLIMNQHIEKEFHLDVATLDQALEMLNKNRLDGICGVPLVLKYSLTNARLNSSLVAYKSESNTQDFTAVVCLKKSLTAHLKKKIRAAINKIKITTAY